MAYDDDSEEFHELSWDEILAEGDFVELSDEATIMEWADYYLWDFDLEDIADFWEYFDEEYSTAA